MGTLRERLKKVRTDEGRPKAPTRAKKAKTEEAKKAQLKAQTEVGYSVRKRRSSIGREQYLELKDNVRRKLLDALDLTILNELTEDEVDSQIRSVGGKLLDQSAVSFNREERDLFLQEIVDDVVGFGPLEPLLQDPEISDILVNGAKQVYVDRRGQILLSDVEFRDDKHLRHVIDRIVSKVGRHVDESSPMCDSRLPDGSRVNAIIPPLAVDYPVLSIRKFRSDTLSMDQLIAGDTISAEVAELCKACVAARLNILISGGTGSGKTTLLNIFSAYISDRERIITIEDSAELQLQQPHVVRLETRPPNIEGKGGVTQYELLINCLRMRPDRIILGEIRGREALDMLQAMNTGHDGSMSTVHANTPRDALIRLETMVAMGGMDLPQTALRQQISSALDVIVQTQRLPDGTRKMTYFSEVVGMEGEMITMQDIFKFERKGVSEDGKSLGEHAATGVVPRFLDKIRATGINVSPDLFIV